jgi:hypothetical protein
MRLRLGFFSAARCSFEAGLDKDMAASHCAIGQRGGDAMAIGFLTRGDRSDFDSTPSRSVLLS